MTMPPTSPFEGVPDAPQHELAPLGDPGRWRRLPKKVWVGAAIVSAYITPRPARDRTGRETGHTEC
jgi:hypothetical protein